MSVQQSYVPSEDVLAKYAELIVKFGLKNRDGRKLKKGDVVHFQVPEVARPLYFHLQTAILKNGYVPMGEYLPSSDAQYKFQHSYFAHASNTQLAHTSETLTKAKIDLMDCTIKVLAPTDLHEANAISDKKMSILRQAQRKGTLYRRRKMNNRQLNWTIVLYGTEALAQEAGMTLKQYWQQIIKACYLDSNNPVSEWKKIDTATTKIAQKLTALQIDSLHVLGTDVDLNLKIGADRSWLAGGGCNIPSYEVFTSPTWQGTSGWIKFNQPLYRDGKKVEGIELHFKNGKVSKVSADKNLNLLKEVLKEKNADKLGEFSLTDARHSRITKFMAETLYDENVGGKFGNTHVAIGDSFRDTFTGEINKNWKSKDWMLRGFNHSVIHIDMVSTTNRTVTATLQDGSQRIIYKDGSFTL